MEVRHELRMQASAADIYAAVSTQEGIRSWWCANAQVGEAVGQGSTLKFNKEGTIVEMAFHTEQKADKALVVWRCTDNANPAWLNTKISTAIKQRDGSCDVVFSHSAFDEEWKGHKAFEMTKQTWNHFMDSLVEYCEEGQGQPW